MEPKRGGGVLLYIREDISWDRFDISLDISNRDIEVLSVCLNRKFQNKLIITTVYIPPHGNLDSAFSHLDKLAGKIISHNYEWILGGDVNIDLACINSPAYRKSKNFSARNLLEQLIKKPTRICSTRKSILDHIYVNCPEKVSEAGWTLRS